jgi:hypothetical protein
MCRVALAAGDVAAFDSVTRELRCVRCLAAYNAGHEPERTDRTGASRARRQAEAERDRIKALIADAREALDRARQVS